MAAVDVALAVGLDVGPLDPAAHSAAGGAASLQPGTTVTCTDAMRGADIARGSLLCPCYRRHAPAPILEVIVIRAAGDDPAGGRVAARRAGLPGWVCRSSTAARKKGDRSVAAVRTGRKAAAA